MLEPVEAQKLSAKLERAIDERQQNLRLVQQFYAKQGGGSGPDSERLGIRSIAAGPYADNDPAFDGILEQMPATKVESMRRSILR